MPETSTTPSRTDVDQGEAPASIDGSQRAVGRYDLLLALIPVAFLVGGVASIAVGLPLRVALPAAATVSALALVDGLFLNPPRRPGSVDGSP